MAMIVWLHVQKPHLQKVLEHGLGREPAEDASMIRCWRSRSGICEKPVHQSLAVMKNDQLVQRGCYASQCTQRRNSQYSADRRKQQRACDISSDRHAETDTYSIIAVGIHLTKSRKMTFVFGKVSCLNDVSVAPEWTRALDMLLCVLMSCETVWSSKAQVREQRLDAVAITYCLRLDTTRDVRTVRAPCIWEDQILR